MTKSNLTKLAAFSLCAVMTGACDTGTDADFDTPRGALLYDLGEAELEAIHAAYLPNEDIELTRARLTAPFDCSQYDQFCEQVGRDAAYEITGEMVDLALDEATPEAIEAHLDARIDEVTAAAAEAPDQDEFRASSGWVTQTNGNFRLRVRHGVTTPLLGDRRAWTEAQTQKKSLGIWSNKPATHLCVNAGTNTQVKRVQTAATGVDYYLLESINPGNLCSDLVKTKTVSTYHDRNSGTVDANTSIGYYIYVNGCASAEINGLNFSACKSEYYQYY